MWGKGEEVRLSVKRSIISQFSFENFCFRVCSSRAYAFRNFIFEIYFVDLLTVIRQWPFTLKGRYFWVPKHSSHNSDKISFFALDERSLANDCVFRM